MTDSQPNGAVSAVNPSAERVVDSPKVWTTLITNNAYLSGLLTLDYSLKQHHSAYPLVALYTETFPQSGLDALQKRNIPTKKIPYLLPKTHKDFTNDPRFYDCWSKLAPFSLVEYERVVQLDSDMLVLKNMDELMEIPLDSADKGGKGERVFAASHACLCNPLKKPHYPKDWTPENCAFTAQHATPEAAQVEGVGSDYKNTMPNGGLQVVIPSAATYELILSALEDEKTSSYDFSDQSLLGDVFKGRWVPLPYIYNALKTLRWKGVHDAFWWDGEVKNVHYILSPKPFEESEEQKRKEGRDGTHGWWWDVNAKRLEEERAWGVEDGF